MENKKVGIIGAGPSGICAAKHAFQNNLTPIVFEKEPFAGGLWAPNTAAWSDLCAIHSRYSMLYSDFAWPSDAPLIPSLNDVNKYLNDYIDHFNLRSYFNFNSNVVKVKFIESNKQWKIEWIESTTNKVTETLVDFIIFSSGLNSQPRIPNNESLKQFKGLVMHSSQIKSSFNPLLKDKKLIIVGNGLSGIEISSQMVGHAASVVNVFTRPILNVPRIVVKKCDNDPNHFNLIPIDLFLFRRENFFCSREYLIDFLAKTCPIQTNKEKCPEAIFYDLNAKENLPPRIIVDNKYVEYVCENRIKAKKTQIKTYLSNGVEFEDGSIEEADVIIFCTGYLPNTSYLDQETKEKLNYKSDYYKFPFVLYKWTFHSELENAAFINQTLGVFFIASELQVKLAMKVFLNEIKLPDKDKLKENVEKEKERRELDHKLQFPNGSYALIIDKLAEELNCLPNLDYLKESNKNLYDMFWKNPILSVHFDYENESKRENCLNVMSKVDEILNTKYSLNIHDDSLHNQIYSEVFEKLNQIYKLPNDLAKYLLKN